MQQRWSERIEQAQQHEVRIACDDSVLVDDIGFLSCEGGRWTLWGDVCRGGLETAVIDAMVASDGIVRRRHATGASHSFRNGSVPSGKELFIDAQAQTTYVPHGSFGWTDVRVREWIIHPVIPDAPIGCSLEELRLGHRRIWRLPDMEESRRVEVSKRPVPTAEAVSEHRDSYEWGDNGYVQSKVMKRWKTLRDIAEYGTFSIKRESDDWMDDLIGAIRRGRSDDRYRQLLQSWTAVQSTTVKRIKPHHRAPFSARGRLITVAKTADEALHTWQQLGIITGLSEEVPDGRGRLCLRHGAYDRVEVPTLPPTTSLWHTMSWVDAHETKKRLKSIFKQGLLSTSERERLGMTVGSLDPGGDKLQSIDWAVACSIGRRPSYEHYGKIHLRISESVLQRREMFFSDTTRWSFKAYREYNEQFDHGRFWMPCDPETTAAHLKTLTADTLKPGGKCFHNEIWIGWKIAPDEIEEIVITDKSIYEQFKGKYDIPVRYLRPSSVSIPVSMGN